MPNARIIVYKTGIFPLDIDSQHFSRVLSIDSAVGGLIIFTMSSQQQEELLTHLPLDPKDRPMYTQQQLLEYFQRIQLPSKYLQSPVLSNKALASSDSEGLPLLRALHRHHVVYVRFDNLVLHYSVEKRISLDTNHLFEKFVTRGLSSGRGGRCMEHNTFFGTVLRSLGYDVKNCCGRVSRMMYPSKTIRTEQGRTYDPWDHMLNLVRFEGRQWVVDVGMGAYGPNIVYPLQDGFEEISIPPRRIRLQLRSIPETTSWQPENSQKYWCYDVCHEPDKPDEEKSWVPTYCFTETEFLPQDYEAMSCFTSTHPKSFFTRDILVTRLLLDEKQDYIVGDITLFNRVLRKIIHGKREILKEISTEEERLCVLEDYFEEYFTEEEKRAVTIARLA